jgi:FkbM family methyltransferase
VYGINPVAWFEADPITYAKLVANVLPYKGHTTHNLLLGDVDQSVVQFNITSKPGVNGNNGSSSFLPLGKHAEHHPHITVTKQIVLPMKRFDTFVKETSFDVSLYNFLNVDVQGAELHVIKGMGNFINDIDYIVVEVNEAELYKGGALLKELDAYLVSRGFVMTVKNINKYEYGDAFYVRER